MTLIYYASFLAFLIGLGVSSESTITFRATPRIIHPVISKTLELRCAVENGKSSRRIPSGWTTYSSSAVQPLKSDPNSSTQEDVSISNITSITISFEDKKTGDLVTIASVWPYGSPTAVSDIEKLSKVDGSTTNSSLSTEQGFLSVTFEYPYEEQAGMYTCEVGLLDAELHPLIGSSRIEVALTPVEVQDLVLHVNENEKYISQLQNLTSALQNQMLTMQQTHQQELRALQDRVDNMKSQNIQQGYHSGCSRNIPVTFAVPYKEPPMIFLSLSYYSHHNHHDSADYVIKPIDVTKTGFTLYCTGVNLNGLVMRWLAVDA